MSTDQGLSRRDFLSRSFAAGAGLLTIGAAHTVHGARALPTVTLGKTGAVVSKLGFGSSFNLTPRLLSIALKEGLSYFDSSENYGNGNSERSIGQALAASERRGDAFVVTKTGRHDPALLEGRLAGSLERLQTDYADAYFLHNLGRPELLDDTMKGAVAGLKKSGKIRFFGFSTHHRNMVPTLEKAASVGFVDLIMFKYNFLDYDNTALNRAIDRCAKADIGLVAMKTQGGAATVPEQLTRFKEKGFNPFQAALKAVMADDRIHVAISEMTNIQQLRENTDAAKDIRMGAVEQTQLEMFASAASGAYCRGCGDICESRMSNNVNIADTLRFRNYHRGYGKPDDARRLFRALPESERQISSVDFGAAEAACPYGLPVGEMMRDAEGVLA